MKNNTTMKQDSKIVRSAPQPPKRKPVKITGMIAAGLIRKAEAHAKARGETMDQFTARAVANYLDDSTNLPRPTATTSAKGKEGA